MHFPSQILFTNAVSSIKYFQGDQYKIIAGIMIKNTECHLIKKLQRTVSKKEKLSFACSTLEDFRGNGSEADAAIADDFLTAVVEFTESNLEFAIRNDGWIGALIGIIEDHAASSRPSNSKQHCFSYHDSYEKAIFSVLNMVETSSFLKEFLGTLDRLGLTDTLVQSFGVILVNDISYATQVC
jgi:hypothetical protein